jgi:hypothetical protein
LRGLALAFGLAIAVGLVEGGLRVGAVKDQMPLDLSNTLYTCYEPGFPEQYIFARIPPLGMEIHRPGLARECRWNGHAWWHRADRFGQRNPETWEEVDVVLLGDSMIYGHGVDEEQTVASYLRPLLNRRVANLGQTGGCAVQYMPLLNNFGLPLHPQVAVVLFFASDLTDVSAYRSPEAIRRFVETGRAPEARVVSRDETLREDLRVLYSRGVEGALRRSMLYRLGWHYQRVLRQEVAELDRSAWSPFAEAMAQSGPEPGLRVDDLDAPAGWFTDELAYTHRALAIMARAAKANGTELVIGYLPALEPDSVETDQRLPKILERYADELGAPFFDATPVLADDGGAAAPGTRLRNDFHLTAWGHRMLARGLAQFLRERELL